MRTYLTRPSMTAAGVVLTALGLAGVAHADDGEQLGVMDSANPQELSPVEPCDELTASDDMVMVPVDPNEPHTPLPPGEIELVPCYQLPTDPEDGDGDGGGGDGGDEPADDGENGGGNSGGGNGGGNGDQDGQPSGDSSDGVGGEGSADTADEGSSSQPRETVTPTAATGGDGNGALMLAILAGALGALGVFLLTYGLRKRPRRGQQPA